MNISKQQVLATLPYIAWTQALVAMAGSLFFSEVLHWVPCVLCWYQRILMYPLVLLLGVAIARKDKQIGYYVLPLAVLGLGIAVYHYLLQMGVISEGLAPCVNGVSCASKAHTWFGFVTIPLLSAVAFAVISVTMGIYTRNIRRNNV